MSNKRSKPAESPTTPKIDNAKTAKMIAESAATITEWAAQALGIVKKLGIKNEPVEHFWLSPAQRDVILTASSLSKTTKGRLADGSSSFTINEVASMMNALAEQLPKVDARKRTAIVLVVKHLIERLGEGTAGPAKPKADNAKNPRTKAGTKALFQFKITLKDSKPPIWRRIQVEDCTLDKLHEHIQTAMGWTNSHIHNFTINDKEYGDPELLDDGFEGFECVDSTKTNLGQILPKTGKRFSFAYEYDFGDGWEHEILFEGSPPVDPKAKYPLCLEGERACPPEDCGGVWGYGDFLEAIRNPKHEEHESMLRWIGGRFDPEKFDAKKATKEMKKGLPDWRSMR